MSYNNIAAIARDFDLQQRLIACAAEQGHTEPETFIEAHIWTLAASPGWAAAWGSALATDPPNARPGYDESVITDGNILSAVQALT